MVRTVDPGVVERYRARFGGTRSSDPTSEFARVVQPAQRYEAARYVVPPSGEDPWEGAYPAVAAGSTRLVCISDTHSAHRWMRPLPRGDVLVHAGDFTSCGTREEVLDFAEWFAGLEFAAKVVVAGNHDLSFDTERCACRGVCAGHETTKRRFVETVEAGGGIYLEDGRVEIAGLSFYGSPWQPEFGDWGFNLARGGPCLDKWREIPPDIDVLITHGPPLGRGDEVHDGCRAGCRDLLVEIQTRIRPKCHIFGHIHEAHGASSDGTTDFVNPATCDLDYEPVQHPFVLDLPRRDDFS